MYLDLGYWNVTVPNVARGIVVTGSIHATHGHALYENTLGLMTTVSSRRVKHLPGI
jgi:hypothetical protein